MSRTDRLAERRVVIDRRSGAYLSFPDVAFAGEGRLVAVYQESESHHPRSRRLLWRVSDDLGRTWKPQGVLRAYGGHCPRLSVHSDGRMAMISDGPGMIGWSYDRGERFDVQTVGGLEHSMPDRLIEMPDGACLTTAHVHRGQAPAPVCGQPPTEQMVFRSHNRGKNFAALSLLSHDPALSLCEASMCLLPDGRLLALMRENSGVYEPMYCRISEDGGRTWAEPAPTPLIGHRPTVGVTLGGKLLVTYRDVGPRQRTAAWLGDLDELTDFEVHGRLPEDGWRLTDEGLFVAGTGGREGGFRLALRPISWPLSARAEFSLSVSVEQAGENGLGVRFGGVWWRILPGFIRPMVAGGRNIRLPEGVAKLRLRYEPGMVTLAVNGRTRKRLPVAADVTARAVAVGNRDLEKDNAAAFGLHAMRLCIEEPRYARAYSWAWEPGMGLPNAWERARVLTLRDAPGAWFGDMGYSGWCETAPGFFFCAYHHADADAPGYEPGKSAWIEGVTFTTEDFSDET